MLDYLEECRKKRVTVIRNLLNRQLLVISTD
uniref:Uncharacterized protein n=1 Tax=virus sp. ctML55 TaxID=2827627 RepID=A0A8S5RIG4_9VIRU|nr:MAG TPA: hypothetical protein [virus sp. ctML55]